MRRKPAVAGYFYESNADELVERIKWSINHALGPRREVGERKHAELLSLVVPHAGYVYSGPIAAHAYVELKTYGRPDALVIVGPNHYGFGAPVAIYDRGEWETPLGVSPVDSELAQAIVKHCRKEVEPDLHAFDREHSIEVQLPFIQYLLGDVPIVPITMWRQTLSSSRALGNAIAKAAEELGRRVVVVSSSDFNHYEPHDVTVEKDMRVIERILALDEEGFMREIERFNVSVCGYGPIVVAISFSKARGCNAVELLKHATSGDTSGYRVETVGYAAIGFYYDTK